MTDLPTSLAVEQQEIARLTELYRWKAENNIRFFTHLKMTEKEKVDFLAREFAFVYSDGTRDRLKLSPQSGKDIR